MSLIDLVLQLPFELLFPFQRFLSVLAVFFLNLRQGLSGFPGSRVSPSESQSTEDENEQQYGNDGPNEEMVGSFFQICTEKRNGIDLIFHLHHLSLYRSQTVF